MKFEFVRNLRTTQQRATDLRRPCYWSAVRPRDTCGRDSGRPCAYFHGSKTWSATLRAPDGDCGWSQCAPRPYKPPRRSKVRGAEYVWTARPSWGGWHCRSRAATSDVCGTGRGVKASHLRGRSHRCSLYRPDNGNASSIHIGSENIYPLWNGWSNNGPVVFKERGPSAEKQPFPHVLGSLTTAQLCLLAW